MTIFLTVLHVVVCAILVVVVLVQHGKGADIGAVFGGGASNTVFGSRGAGNFMTRLTTGAAILFMVTSLSLSYIANTRSSGTFFEDPPAAADPAGGAFEEVAPAPAPEPAAGGFEEVAPPAAPETAPQAAAEPAVEPAPAPEAEPPVTP